MVLAWLTGAVRTALQVVWGSVAAWLIVHGINVSENVPDAVTAAALALVTAVFTAVVIWLEHRPGDGWAAKLGRAVSKLLMFGLPAPTYTRG